MSSTATCCQSCGCNPCGCGACNYNVFLPSESTPSFVFANVNVGGVGVLDGVSGTVNVNFRGVGSANSMMTVALDAPNSLIVFTLDATQIANNLPAATTTQAGVLETATDAEAIAKAANNKILVPSNLAAYGATTTFAGLSEIATQAEVNAGVASNVFVAPDTLGVLLGTKKYTATWANDVARVALAPTFEGQFGYQLDTNQAYIGTGVVAGDWGILFTEGTTQTLDENTEVDIDGVNLVFGGSGALNISVQTTDISSTQINFTGGQVTSSTPWQQQADIDIDNANIDFINATVQINTGNVANSVLISNGTNHVSSQLINTFISSANTQTGWSVTNPSVSRTIDVSAATLAEVRAVLGTLINDLKGIKLPAT